VNGGRAGDDVTGFFKELGAFLAKHADLLLPIFNRGGVAIAFYEFADETTARAWGWSPERPILAMPRKLKKRLAQTDKATKRWLAEPHFGPHRVFMCVHRGTFLVNYVEGEGFSLEPGSIDAEREDAEMPS
jgi:hypothetical protein